MAEKAGLRVGDALIRVNNTDIYQLRHKDAQDAVSRAGNNFELVVSRSVLISGHTFAVYPFFFPLIIRKIEVTPMIVITG